MASSSVFAQQDEEEKHHYVKKDKTFQGALYLMFYMIAPVMKGSGKMIMATLKTNLTKTQQSLQRQQSLVRPATKVGANIRRAARGGRLY